VGQHGSGAWTLQSRTQREREPLCRNCAVLGRVTEAVCVDHKIPISEGGSLHDPENLQPLCAACHRRKSAIEAAARPTARGPYPNEGWVVLGAPGAGKTTLVREHAGAADYVWDYDAVLAAMRIKHERVHDLKAMAFMNRVRRAMLEAWRDGFVPSRVWWITTSVYEAREITASMPSVRLRVVRASLDELARRIEARSWLTPEQRAAMLGETRNIVATIEAMQESSVS
jgi:hypothetical protein